MNKALYKIAKKIFKLMGKYIKKYNEVMHYEDEFIWIINECNEIICFASNVENIKKHVKYLKENN